MRPRAVVVGRVPGKHLVQVSLAEISMRSVTSVLTVNTKRSAKQFARGHRGGILTTSTPTSARTARTARTATNDAVNCPARSRMRKPEPSDVFAEVNHEVRAC